MLLGGEAQVDSYSPTSNGNISATENDNISLNGNSDNNSSPLDSGLSNVNLLQQTPSPQIQTINDDYKVSAKDNNQNFLPENNMELYHSPPPPQQQPSHHSHVSPRVQPYDLNVAHHQAHHHLRSGSHISQYNGNGRKLNSPLSQYKNLSMINHNTPMYDGMVSSSSGNDLMILKEEPENGF